MILRVEHVHDSRRRAWIQHVDDSTRRACEADGKRLVNEADHGTPSDCASWHN